MRFNVWGGEAQGITNQIVLIEALNIAYELGVPVDSSDSQWDTLVVSYVRTEEVTAERAIQEPYDAYLIPLIQVSLEEAKDLVLCVLISFELETETSKACRWYLEPELALDAVHRSDGGFDVVVEVFTNREDVDKERH
jgi:hypothetical protein